VTTVVKRIGGDRDLFLNELRAVLKIPQAKNPKLDAVRLRTGGTIEIKGNHVWEVKHWLASLGF
jgi:Mitochondrial large subunit ribosomal protein (Img2)